MVRFSDEVVIFTAAPGCKEIRPSAYRELGRWDPCQSTAAAMLPARWRAGFETSSRGRAQELHLAGRDVVHRTDDRDLAGRRELSQDVAALRHRGDGEANILVRHLVDELRVGGGPPLGLARLLDGGDRWLQRSQEPREVA